MESPFYLSGRLLLALVALHHVELSLQFASVASIMLGIYEPAKRFLLLRSRNIPRDRVLESNTQQIGAYCSIIHHATFSFCSLGR